MWYLTLPYQRIIVLLTSYSVLLRYLTTVLGAVSMSSRDMLLPSPGLGASNLNFAGCLDSRRSTGVSSYIEVIFFSVTYISFAAAYWPPPNGNINRQ
jgi:hypothetical protein